MIKPNPPSKIADRIWSGGVPDTTSTNLLRRSGVTHLLNVSSEPNDPSLSSAFQVRWYPTVDDLRPKPAGWFHQGLSFARHVLAAPANQLYVHCREGRHRGPLMTYVILRTIHGLSPNTTRRTIETQRVVAEFPRAYLDSAEAFLRQIDHE